MELLLHQADLFFVVFGFVPRMLFELFKFQHVIVADRYYFRGKLRGRPI